MEEINIKVEIPEEFKEEIEKSNINLPNLIRELITLKLFEEQLKKSKALQRALFESLIDKSKLTKEGAKELADIINKGMLKKLKAKFSGI